MSRLAIFCLIFLTGFSLSSQANSLCNERTLVVDQTQLRDFSGFSWSQRLPSYSHSQGMYFTDGETNFIWNGLRLNINFQFNLPEDAVAKYYNIYRIEFDIGEGEDAFHYEDGNCLEPIGDFAPKRPLRFFPIKIPAHSDGSPRGIEPMRVKIWGRQ